MKIIHIVHNNWTAEQVGILSSFGIRVDLGYDRFDIEEGFEYEKLNKYLDKWKVEKSIGTIYEKKDIDESDLLVYVSSWLNGYPQPEDVKDYLGLTYNTDNYCSVCGIGAFQKEPFRIKKEPKWGEKKMFELNWVFDEVFVRKDIYQSIFQKIGIDYFPVILHKKETIIENTVQLKLPSIENSLLLENQPHVICKKCKRKKYSPHIKGYFPSFKKPVINTSKIFKSIEYFGSSTEAHNKIFITKELYQKLKEVKIKATLWPVR